MSSIPNNKELDWKQIWKKQRIYPEMENELQKLALLAQNFLKEKAGRRLVRTICRQVSTWHDFKNIPYELNANFQKTLILK